MFYLGSRLLEVMLQFVAVAFQARYTPANMIRADTVRETVAIGDD
jgi:hypothetical protein